MSNHQSRPKVGDLRPSQVLFSFGVGSIIDLPNLSVMVMGLDDWDTQYMTAISEDRLLAVVRKQIGHQVERLCFPPVPSDESTTLYNPFDESMRIGIPVAPFPRWVRCPLCHLLAPLNSGLFQLKESPYHPERTHYIHINCSKSRKPPKVLPARFLIACEQGHLDDFPWSHYVHKGQPCSSPILRLREWGVSGSVAEVEVSCDTCGAKRRMRDAFVGEEQNVLPPCRGRRPHLRDFQEKVCEETVKCITLGASNSWFPITLSSLYIPTATTKLDQLVEEYWSILESVTSIEVLEAFRKQQLLQSLSEFTNEQIWESIKNKRKKLKKDEEEESISLKFPEWETLAKPSTKFNTADFQIREVEVPHDYQDIIERVVLVERLREVRALIGFTRIDAPDYFEDIVEVPRERRVSLSRRSPKWVPASEVRGEGIFIQFKEERITKWVNTVKNLEKDFFEAHTQWRRIRNIDNPEQGFPGIRYVMLHTFSHALMRQISIECGYTAASIRERIYSSNPENGQIPMAGVLIYTGAADSEGTLGGLVGLGEPNSLGRHINQALEQSRLCSSDPLCEENHPWRNGLSLHGAACHACLFAPETSCEYGNKYLDRCTIVKTFSNKSKSFFDG